MSAVDASDRTQMNRTPRADLLEEMEEPRADEILSEIRSKHVETERRGVRARPAGGI